LNRVISLADRERSQQPDGAANYEYIIPLPEVLGEIEGYGPKSNAVQEQFQQVISQFGNEFTLMRQTPIEYIRKANRPVLAEAIRRIRNDEVDPQGGYDGVYGVIKIFKNGEIDRIRGQLGFFGIDEYKAEEKAQAAEPETRFEPEKREAEKQEFGTFGLNSEQQKVRNSLSGATLVQAGPGTGKTHTLIEWLVHQVESGSTVSGELLAVTFTNKAAGEMKERLQKRLGSQAQSITIGTFHALAWQWLRQRYDDLNTVFDVSDRRMTLQILYPDLSPSEINKLAQLIGRHLELHEPMPGEYRDYARAYRLYTWKQGAIDLTDLIRKTVEELESDNEWLQQLRDRYRAIAVDELQDINPMQYRIIELLGTGQNILAIGDPDQSIYGFRGSDVELFFRFAEDFDAREISLVQNYRSTNAILKAAGSVIRHNSISSDSHLKSQNNESHPIEIFQAENPFEEADYILEQIKKYVGGTDSLTTGVHTDSEFSYGFGDIGILFRTHSIGKALFKSFLKSGIPVHLGDGTAFLSEPPFTIVADLLHLYQAPESSIHLSNILSGTYDWKDRQVMSFLTLLEQENQTLFGDASFDTLSPDHQQDIEDLGQMYRQLSDVLENKSIAAAVKIICDRYLPNEELDETTILKKETLLELAEEADGDVTNFLEQMQLNPYTDAGRLQIEGVHLLTFHAAKGLEFPVVFVAGAEEGITPLQRDDVNLEEERRLFYVAMTRAEDRLHISGSAERMRYGDIETNEPSRFIREIPGRWKTTERQQKEKKLDKPPSGEENQQMKLF